MSKRTWAQANTPPNMEASATRGSISEYRARYGHSERNNSVGSQSQNTPRSPELPREAGSNDQIPRQPTISRKVKACAACRKQKIKCLMDENGPPCKRCKERNLSCVLNKSLQTLIDEKSKWKVTVSHDLGNIHNSLQDVLKKLSLPPLPALRTAAQTSSEELIAEDSIEPNEEPGLSYDVSPGLSPRGDGLTSVPIDSLYQITRLRALRATDADGESQKESPSGDTLNDFISRGLLSTADAERLLDLYLNRLDHFIYLIGSRYKDLNSLRRGSAILTACICTVSALHEPNGSQLYSICSREFRRLMSAAMFSRRIGRDHLAAMCIASYWLSDISWTVSGYAIRRATELNLSANFHRVIKENDKEAAECLRLWYILYICDQHLSILYGRPSIIREDLSVREWEAFLRTPLATESDRRMIAQLTLLIIVNTIRERMGSDTGAQLPSSYTTQIEQYNQQLDKWVTFWTTKLKLHHDYLGDFPTKGVVMHYHFALLHLHSYIFRNLGSSPVPPYFHSSASAAVSAANAIIDMLLTDKDVANGLVGMAHYLHTMTAFACVFLVKIAIKYPGQFVQTAVVEELTTQLVHKFRTTPVSSSHLVHLMADGLDRLIDSTIKASPSSLLPPLATVTATAGETTAHGGSADNGGATASAAKSGAQTPLPSGPEIQMPMEGFMAADMAFGSSSLFDFDTENFEINYGAFGFI